MNVVKSRSINLPRAKSSLDGQYVKSVPNINLYQEIPTVEVSLDDFEEFALDRLKVRINMLPCSSYIVNAKDDNNIDQFLVSSQINCRFSKRSSS